VAKSGVAGWKGFAVLQQMMRGGVLGCLLVGAATATFGRCLDQQAAASSVEPDVTGLTYQCLQLKSGVHMWVGEAGAKTSPAVLLVHGLGYNAHRDWQPVMPALLSHHRVIALDLPGFGASPTLPGGYAFPALAQVLDELLEQKQVVRVHVVGHSLGGAVALYFAHAFPQRVDRVVLVDAAGILHQSIFARHIARVDLPQSGLEPVDRVLSMIDERINGVGRMLMRRMDAGFDFVRWLADNPGVRQALLGGASQADAAVGLVEHNFATAIRSVRAPVTLIWGADDPTAPVRTGRLLASRLPDARLQVIEGAGHVPMTQSTERFNALLAAALREPLGNRHVAAVAPESREEVVCRGQSNVRYSGRFKSLKLDRCSDVVIESARIESLEIRDSTVTMYDTVVSGPDMAMRVFRSRVMGTALSIEGSTAIWSDESELDLAGVSLRARQKALDMPGSGRVYFSVSDVVAPDFTGDAHFIRWAEGWPRATQ
jgi:pimeloyl-ACP methyl ester carboxylesterase